MRRLVKSLLGAGRGERPLTVLFGLFRGIRLNLDLNHQLQVYLGLWERETYSFVRKATKNARWAIDVGSARGEFSLFLLRLKTIEKLVAVEPFPLVSRMMASHLELNHFANDTRLSLVKRYLGVSPEPQQMRMDELEVNHNQPGFIKVDVDGGELDVLQSGEKLLRDARPTLLVETHSLELETNCLKLLQQWGYHCRIIKNAWWRRFIPEDRPVGHNRWLAATPIL